MRKSIALAAMAFAALILADGVAAHARQTPPPIQVRPIKPFESAVTSEQIVHAITACRPAVGLVGATNLNALDEAHWSRAPDQTMPGFQLRSYTRYAILDQLKIADRIVACVTTARVANAEHTGQTISEIARAFSLVAFDDFKGFEKFKQAVIAEFGEDARKTIFFSDKEVFTFEMSNFEGNPVIVINVVPTTAVAR